MGGNVNIGNETAQRIDLNLVNRTEIVQDLILGLSEINSRFHRANGLNLWNSKLFYSNEYLSGSSFHFFNLNKITDEEFVKYKKIVGDIDVQVDVNMKGIVFDFLKSIPLGTKFWNLIFLGFKNASDQFISLWNLSSHNLNIQIDFELVSYQYNRPTAWSTFSRKSAWEDMKEGIKGVFQKYMLRALQKRNAKDIIILAKTSRGKDRVETNSPKSFSLKGLRQTLEPVVDEKGQAVIKDGKEVYKEIPSVGAVYNTNFGDIFKSSFDIEGTEAEIELMYSFVGLVSLCKKLLSKQDQTKVVDRFAELLWANNAQGIVRDNPTEDFDTKLYAFNFLTKELSSKPYTAYQDMIDAFYKAYKRDAK